VTVIDVRLLQSALKQQGFWGADPITCLYDARTARLMKPAIERIEEKARESLTGDLFLSAHGIEDGELDDATVIHPSADRSSISIEPSSVYDRALQTFRSRVTLQPCGSGPGTAVSSESVVSGAPTFEPAPAPPRNFNGDTPDALCFCVGRLAQGLWALGVLESPEHDGWDNEVAQAWMDATQAFLGFIPPVTGRVGDRFIWAHFAGDGASSHEEALASFRPLQNRISAARTEQDLTPGPDCCPPREGSFAVAERRIIEAPEGEGEVVEVQEESAKPFPWLAVGLGVTAFGGGLWWALKRKGPRR
jgi:hypothetical protein